MVPASPIYRRPVHCTAAVDGGALAWKHKTESLGIWNIVPLTHLPIYPSLAAIEALLWWTVVQHWIRLIL